MSPNYKTKKVSKKQRRCEAIIQKDCNVRCSDEPTRFLALLNAGLSTGLTEEVVLAAATPFGAITQLVMLLNKSYCFLECVTISDAKLIFDAIHNVAQIGQNKSVVFLSFFQQLPASSDNVWRKATPEGLWLLTDFVSLAEEEALLKAIHAGEDNVVLEAELKHRRVKHFGYEFLYGVNNVDDDQPLSQGLPTECDTLWPRFQLAAAERKLSLDWQVPDQLTVNEYEPGQGIPPHVDTHSAFLDPILSLSLQGDLVMDFRKGSERRSIQLPRRSLLVLSGEARYDWVHGITPRIIDVVPSPTGALTTKTRTKRTSLTFRRLRRAPCNCAFPVLCDSRLKQNQTSPPPMLDELAVRLEELNVHSVYDQIASHFSETRHTPWPQVGSFLESFEAGSVLLDVGCGNGKYLSCNRDTLTIGCDRSHGLLGVCTSNGKSVFRCDCLQVPVRSQSIDGCISIAVIHHLATPERRLAAVREMARILRPGGRALIYVWAKNQRSDSKKSSYLLQNKAVNKHKTTEAQQRQITEQELMQESNGVDVHLPIHTNRTNFQQQDVLVPWKLKGGEQQLGTFLRYYHVFEEEELKKLVARVPEVELLHDYYDQGNHCVIFQRK